MRIGGSPGPRPLPSPANTWHGRLLDVSLLIYTSISTGTGVVSGRSLPRATHLEILQNGKGIPTTAAFLCESMQTETNRNYQKLNKLFSEDRLWQMTLTNFYHLGVRDPLKKFRSATFLVDVSFGHICVCTVLNIQTHTHTHIYIYV